MSIPDKVLVKQFKDLLLKMRDAPIPELREEFPCDNWREWKILPFLDLEDWFQETGMKPPTKEAYAKALSLRGGTDTLRKYTIPWANKMMTDRFLNAFEARLAGELIE